MNLLLATTTNNPVQENLLDLFQMDTLPVGKLSVSTILISLAFTLLLSAIMFFTFKKCHTPMTYNQKYNITLVMLAIVSTILMQLIKQNLALSLGMLGSLSIVRFRTNIKDPRDLGFVFWAMTIGIASSSEGWFLGIIGSILLSIFMIMTGDNKSQSQSRLLVIRGSKANTDKINDILAAAPGKSQLQAQNLLADSFELVYEIKAKHMDEQKLAEEIMALPGIDTVNLLAPSADLG